MILSSIKATLVHPGMAFFTNSSTGERNCVRRGELIDGFEVEELYPPVPWFAGYAVLRDHAGHQHVLPVGEEIENLYSGPL
ncbi:hypothetical protein JKG47_10050 [Acidithiobacillus sp. MC6.1]|nr:hypothetical protein [Acidithiobacillus sp. MC6.1]